MPLTNINPSPGFITRAITKNITTHVTSVTEHLVNWELDYYDVSATGDPLMGRTWTAGWNINNGGLNATGAGIMTDNFIPTVGVTYTLKWKHTGAAFSVLYPKFGGTDLFGFTVAGEYETQITATVANPLQLSPAAILQVEYFSITS